MITKISAALDRIADLLEAKGFVKEAYELDKVADILDNDYAQQAEEAVKKLLNRFKIKYHRISSEMRSSKYPNDPWGKTHPSYAAVDIEISPPGALIEDHDDNAENGENYKRLDKLADELNKHNIGQTFSSSGGGSHTLHLTLSLNQREIGKLPQLSPS